MWISYNLEWKAEIIEAKVAAKPNGQVIDGYLRIRGPMRIIEWRENSGLKGLQHNPQARSVSDTWLPDFRAGTSWEIWGLLIARGTGPSNVRGARIDVGLVLEPVKGHDNVFRRFGYFEQCYWDNDTYPIFAGDKEKETRSIIII
ncbi:hypothetical protein M758_9G159900 [Ceratodon purpureus]|nr:hypothetical protein M758_9G159900 [Ceratodon purpureus]